MDIKYSNNSLWIGDRCYTYANSIAKVVAYSDVVVVMFHEADKVICNNIMAVDYAGRELWNISDIIKFKYAEAYVVLRKEDERTFSTISYSGVKFWVDIEAREVVRKTITK